MAKRAVKGVIPVKQYKMAKPKVPLSDKQKLFCEYYFQTGSKKQSALQAGYGSKNPAAVAYQLLQNDRVLDYLLELIRKNQKAEALVGHRSLIDLAENAPPAIRLKASIELLNRSGLIVKQEHEVTHKIEDDRTDDEIKAQIAALVTQLGLSNNVIDITP